MKFKTTAEGLEKGVRIKPVVGFEGVYEVTDDGRVWSAPRVVRQRDGLERPLLGRWLKPQKHSAGYGSVFLRREGNTYQRFVHHLVAEMFIGPRPLGLNIDHIDRNKSNNRVSNLRYVKQSVNVHNQEARGCYWDKRVERWYAQIHTGRKHHSLGGYDTEEEARAAYIAAKKRHGVFTP